MERHSKSLPTAYFETMFRETDDPWELETSAYEQAKYDDTLAAVTGRRYSAGFEIGCAKGVLTVKLAAQCTDLLSIDVSETALDAARKRAADLSNVRFERMEFPTQFPAGEFDLVVLSEVTYYWDDDDLFRAARWLDEHIAPGGDMLLVHYTGETDYPQSGDEAVSKLRALLTIPLDGTTRRQNPRYRLDLWRRRPCA